MKTSELFQSLAEAEVDYVLVGGLAVQLHGFMRATIDIDLVVAMSEANLDRFIGVAKAWGLQPNIPVPIETLKDASQLETWFHEKGMLAFSLREPQAGGKVIDVLVHPIVSYGQLARNAFIAELFGYRVQVAAIDDLLQMKRHAGRPKDLLDIGALEKIKLGEDPNA